MAVNSIMRENVTDVRSESLVPSPQRINVAVFSLYVGGVQRDIKSSSIDG